MATQINPRLARLWLADDIRQYGYRSPLVLDSLTEPELRILDYLEAGITASQLDTLPEIARTDSLTVKNIVSRLAPVIIESGSMPARLSTGEIAIKLPELSRLFAPNRDFAASLERRCGSRIFIEELGRPGLVLAKALAASEIGVLLTLDQVRVGEADCLPLGHPKSAIGLPRATSAKQQLDTTELQFHSRMSRSMEALTAAVIISSDIVSPHSYQPWMARDVPHLAICFDESGVEISPLIFPGSTPCIGCIEKARFESDPNWRTIAPQLLALESSNQDAAMILFATGVATNLLLNLIDEGRQPSKRILRLERSGALSSFEPEISQCGCGTGGPGTGLAPC